MLNITWKNRKTELILDKTRIRDILQSAKWNGNGQASCQEQ